MPFLETFVGVERVSDRKAFCALDRFTVGRPDVNEYLTHSFFIVDACCCCTSLGYKHLLLLLLLWGACVFFMLFRERCRCRWWVL